MCTPESVNEVGDEGADMRFLLSLRSMPIGLDQSKTPSFFLMKNTGAAIETWRDGSGQMLDSLNEGI